MLVCCLSQGFKKETATAIDRWAAKALHNLSKRFVQEICVLSLAVHLDVSLRLCAVWSQLCNVMTGLGASIRVACCGKRRSFFVWIKWSMIVHVRASVVNLFAYSKRCSFTKHSIKRTTHERTHKHRTRARGSRCADACTHKWTSKTSCKSW